MSNFFTTSSPIAHLGISGSGNDSLKQVAHGNTCDFNSEAAHPVLTLHVREASAPESSENNSDTELECHQKPEGTPELVVSKLPTVTSSKRSYKNPNLNISIPPLPTGRSIKGLSPSEKTQDPITPLFQIVHTPTTAPGAPGPGDPAEIRRLEESWAANMTEFDQISPAFPNFRPPTFSEFPMKHPYDDPLMKQPDTLVFGKSVPKARDDSSAQREMFALTASATTPTFPPTSLALDFGKAECQKYHSNSYVHETDYIYPHH